MFQIKNLCIISANYFCKSLFFLTILFLILNTEANAKTEYSVKPCTPAWNQFAGASSISSTIHSSVRASDGLIYLGGRDGLYRIQGEYINTWLPDFTNSASIPSGKVKALEVDHQYLWIGTNSGIARLNTANGVMERNDTLNKATGFSPVNAISVADNYLYVANKNGGFVAKLSNDINKIEIVRKYNNTNELTDFLMVSDGLLATGQDGLWLMRGIEQPERIAFDAKNLRDVHQLGKELWIVTPDQLFRGTESLETWREYTRSSLSGLPDSDFTTLTSDTLGRLWIGASKEISRWDLNEEHPAACRRSLMGSNRDQDISVAHLSGDFGDYIFLGSHGRGAAIAPINSGVRLVVPGGHYDSGLPANSIWSHLIDNEGRFIAGTSRGLFKETAKGSGLFDSVAESILGNLRIYSIAETEPGKLWIGTAKGLFFKVGDTQVKQISILSNQDGQLVHPAIFSIKSKDQDLYLATSHGLIVLEQDTIKTKVFFKTKQTVQSIFEVPEIQIPITRVWSMDFIGDRTFIAGSDGIAEVDVQSANIVASSKDNNESIRQPIGYVYNVTVVDENRLFLGTEAGLVETDFDFSEFHKIDDVNGFRLLSVMSSGKDSAGNIWMGVANSGLFRYEPNTDKWSHLTQSDGLITNGVSQLGLSFSRDGLLAVSNGTGASIIDLKSVGLGPNIPLNIRALDSVRKHLFSSNETLQIGPDNRDLNLSFLATELIEHGLHNISYEMWSDSESIRTSQIPLNESLSFINLAPGNYKFSAIVESTSGAVSAPLRFSIIVKPYWWETSLFYGVIIVLIALSVLILYQRRLKNLEQRIDIIGEERKRIAQELHDTSLQEIFGLKMISRSLLGSLSASDKSEDALQFTSLIDKAIASLRKSVASLDSLTTIPSLSIAIEQLKKQIYVPCTLTLNTKEIGTFWHMKHQRRFFVFRVIRESVINSIKHADAEKIDVTLKWTPFALFVSIEDDGKGFDMNSIKYSDTYGLNSIICMAKSAKTKLEITSKVNAGTKLQLRIPRFFI